MKATKKLLALSLALMMALSCMVPALAASPHGGAEEIEIVPGKLQIVMLSEEITPRGVVRTFAIDIPGDGAYHVVNGFNGEYEKGTTLSVTGTWKPSYVPMDVMFKDEVNDTSVDSALKSGETHSFSFWNHSTWGLYVRAEKGDVSGTLQITIS